KSLTPPTGASLPPQRQPRWRLDQKKKESNKEHDSTRRGEALQSSRWSARGTGRVPRGDGAREAGYGKKGKRESGQRHRAKLGPHATLFSIRRLAVHATCHRRPSPAPASTSTDPFTGARDSQAGLAGQQVGRSENSQRAAGNETHKVQGQVEAVKGESSADRGTPRYLVSGDPDLADHYPAWLDNLADDVTVEGSMLDGV